MALRPRPPAPASRAAPLLASIAALGAVLLGACTAASTPSGSAAPSASVTPAPTQSAAPTPTYPLTLTDDAGREVTIPADPQRIVSLAPSNTEIVCALGACDQVVGVNDFRDGFPDDVAAELEDVPDVASFSGVDREAVAAVEPDLILAAGNELTSSADIASLADLGYTVLVLYPESLDEVYADIRLVASALDEAEEGARQVVLMQARVLTVQEQVSGLEAPRTFYEVSVFQGTIYTAGEDSFLAALIETAGGEPITGEAISTSIQLEDLVAADPELILLGDAAYDPSVTPDAVAARPGWGGMTAVLQGRVLLMPDDLLITRPGPRIVDGLEALARAIHPEAFD
jgi:iron complex transport system substrate-binding protein